MSTYITKRSDRNKEQEFESLLVASNLTVKRKAPI
jgi:hypothetical protein